MTLNLLKKIDCNRLLLQCTFLNAPSTYAPDNEWFIQTMNAVFSVGGDKMHPDIPNSFLRLLAEGEFCVCMCVYIFYKIEQPHIIHFAREITCHLLPRI